MTTLAKIVDRSKKCLVAILLVTTFVTTCWAEPVGVYLALAVAILSLVFLDGKALQATLLDRGVRFFLAAFGVLALAFVLGAKRPDDGMAFVDFLALPVVIPAYALLSKYGSPRNVVLISALAAVGCLVAFSVGIYDLNVRQLPRAAGGTSPIFFSDLAVLLGYFALLGLLVWKSPWRWLFAFGNALAVAAALYGGTRGAMLVEAALLAMFSAYAMFFWRRPLYTRAVTVAGTLAITVIVGLVSADLSRTMTIISTASEIVVSTVQITSGDEIALSDDPSSSDDFVVATGDPSTNIRLKLWAAGLEAFLDSPLYGHSWWNRFEAAIPYIPSDIESQISHDKTAHLHNDIINFASGAGLMGVCAYLLLLAAPIVSTWFSPRTEQWRFRVFAASGLSVAYLVMGLTDTMFVFEIPKSMFVLCSAVVMAFFLDAPPRAEAKAAGKAA